MGVRHTIFWNDGKAVAKTQRDAKRRLAKRIPVNKRLMENAAAALKVYKSMRNTANRPMRLVLELAVESSSMSDECAYASEQELQLLPETCAQVAKRKKVAPIDSWREWKAVEVEHDSEAAAPGLAFFGDHWESAWRRLDPAVRLQAAGGAGGGSGGAAEEEEEVDLDEMVEVDLNDNEEVTEEEEELADLLDGGGV